ncbi:hypothetical protein MJT46_005632 [Ovis ammon polii x Ovis aries]|nr:hypothetical protein MJT46_005632 [Ovis ammon polii x Ovis aries]
MGLSFYGPDGLSYCFGRYAGQRTQYPSLGPRQGTECGLKESCFCCGREQALGFIRESNLLEAEQMFYWLLNIRNMSLLFIQGDFQKSFMGETGAKLGSGLQIIIGKNDRSSLIYITAVLLKAGGNPASPNTCPVSEGIMKRHKEGAIFDRYRYGVGWILLWSGF